ncbi:MAG TPA: HD domain-containing phosphohydrolase [Actinomycetes bacterium]|nr:HD domain-containing phosphohydrolase [Actinomycetes bacterium]
MSIRTAAVPQAPAVTLLAAAAGITVTVAAAATTQRGIVQPGTALAFAVFIALGELIRVTLPGERESAPLGMAGALAYAVLPAVGAAPATHPALQVIAVTTVAVMVGVLPHAVAGRAPSMDYLARRILTVAFAALLFRPLLLSDLIDIDTHPLLVTAVMVGVVLATGLFDAALAALVGAANSGAPYRLVLANELHALAGIGSAIGATGMLIALATGAMKLWAIPIFCIPLLLAQFSFRRYASIRATYLQTIRALSRVTEVGGYNEPGHARRVSRLALAVGRELGMNDRELLDLEYAALMHDLGQLSLTDPIPGGATVMCSPRQQRRIAELGAEVIRQTRVMESVAEIVAAQAAQYRRSDGVVDQSVPLASRIIKAANAYDDMVSGSPDPARQEHALSRLQLGTIYEYDPRVVDSLSGIVDRAAFVVL